MALGHSPSIVTNGLVFAYDMGNPQKSWKGAPTTNLFTDSEQFDNWDTFFSSTQSNVILAPNQTLTAEKIIEGTNLGDKNISKSNISISTTPAAYTMSMYLKRSERFWVLFAFWNRRSGEFQRVSRQWFNLQTGTLGGYQQDPTGYANPSASIVDVGDGWYRCSFTATSLIDDTTISCFCNLATEDLSRSYQGDGVSGLYVWGAQLEQGSFATPYVPTSSTTSTRSNTQSILDLTNNNTITASSLTYNSDGTFSFNGNRNYITNGSTDFSIANNLFADSAGSWTVSAWFKFPSSPSGTRTGNQSWAIVGRSGGIATGASFTLFIGSQTDTTYGNYAPYKCACVCRGSVTIISPSSVNDNNWHSASVTWNGTSGKVYFDGVETGNLDTSIGAAVQTYELIIGGTNNGLSLLQSFEGVIPYVQIYNRALSAAEVAQNFNALRGRYGL
jgi:hypothetical protein